MNGERSTNCLVRSFRRVATFETTRSFGIPISSRSSASLEIPEIVATDEDATQGPRYSRDTETVEGKLLGQMVLEYGLLSEEQLELALAEHLSTGVKLGEVLVARGWLTQSQLDWLLEEQAATAAATDMEQDARGIDLLRTRVAEAEAELSPPAEEDEAAGPGHVLFVWSPSGYALISRAGEPPPVGSEVGTSGGSRVVTKIGPSPLPGDSRPCAFLDAP
jgi:hypothetical protein